MNLDSLHRGITCSLIILLYSCQESPVTTQRSNGSYQYRASDSTGILLVTGWMELNFPDSTTISGKWHLDAVENPKNIGPQTGDGKLAGGVHNGQMWVDLNPQFKDNNVVLVGTMEAHRFWGQWMWLTFVGVTNKGRFEIDSVGWGQMW